MQAAVSLAQWKQQQKQAKRLKIAKMYCFLWETVVVDKYDDDVIFRKKI